MNLRSINFNQYLNSRKPRNPNRLQAFYYNDTHGNSDLMAGLVNCARNFKLNRHNLASDTFILSAGDNSSGGDVKKNDYILDVMENVMGVDVSAVGNHEVDAGKDGFYEIAKDSGVQFVATNAKFDANNKMNDIVKKSLIKEQNGNKYGFVGTMPIDFTTCTKEDVREGIAVMDFDETVIALQKEIDNLKKQGVNRIILMSHSGYGVDQKLAQSLDGVDIIIGGHTHSVVKDAKKGENVVLSKTGEPVLITQAGENGKYYGIIDVEFDNNGIVKKVANKLFNSPTMQKSPVLEKIKERFLGISPKVGVIDKAVPLPQNRRTEPCGWTELMADSVKNELNVDISIINSANVRKVPMSGVLTERDVIESTPMRNKLIRTKVTQAQLVLAVKNAAKKTFSNDDGVPGLLQMSGITYKVDDKGNLLEMNFVDKNGNKTPIDINNPSDDVIYTAAYDDFVAQKDGETPELLPKFEVEQFDFDKDKTLIDYIAKLPDKDNLVIETDGRLEIQKTS